MRILLLKTPVQIHHLIDLPNDASQQLEEVVEAAVRVEQAVKVVKVEWAGPCGMELEYSFCSSNAKPINELKILNFYSSQERENFLVKIM